MGAVSTAATSGWAMMRDVFVLHADADGAFVRSHLVPALGLPEDRVLLSSGLPLGTTVVQALEDGITNSKVTVVVVSPAFLAHSWSSFGEELAACHATRGGFVVPLLLKACGLPLRLEFPVRLDCRDPARWDGEIARLRALLDVPASARREIPCPYPGMRAYTAENAALFCGRSRDVDGLVSRIAGGLRELYVIGPSGSGKSSLMSSGVVPQLERAGDPVVGERFIVHTLRPGSRPAHRIAAAVGSPSNWPRRTLVLIDQLEEIFTLADREARSELYAKLDELRAAPACHLALVVRADFHGQLMQSELWPHVQRSYRHEVGPLRGDDLREAITRPARRVGVELESLLIERLLGDAASEPGSLPLIQDTLVHLWGQREHNLLTSAQYTALGDRAASGLAVALARRADAVFGGLDELRQAIAQRVFVRLVAFGENREDTRRQQPRSALRAGETPEQLEATLHDLIAGRLLTADGDEASGEVLIDLAHEALIAAWPKLQHWITAHRSTEPQRRYLEADAAQWARRAQQGRPDVGLLEDEQLIELDEWFTPELRRSIGASDDVAAFVEASRVAVAARAAERDASARRSRARTVLGRLASTLTLAVLVSVVSIVIGLLFGPHQRQPSDQAGRAGSAGANHGSSRREHPDSQADDTIARLDERVSELYRSGKLDEAIPLAQQSLAAREQLHGANHPDVAEGLDGLALLYHARGAYDQVEPLLIRALAIRESALGPTHPAIAVSLNNLALLYNTTDDYSKAEPLFRRALEIRERSLGPLGPEVAASLQNLARLYVARREYAQAEPLLIRALDILSRTRGPDHLKVLSSLRELARLYTGQRLCGKAEPLLLRALELAEKAFGPEHIEVALSLDDLAECYEARGSNDQARPLRRRAETIRQWSLQSQPHLTLP
jgi:tetratricopeptide (TPR) repeat protein